MTIADLGVYAPWVRPVWCLVWCLTGLSAGLFVLHIQKHRLPKFRDRFLGMWVPPYTEDRPLGKLIFLLICWVTGPAMWVYVSLIKLYAYMRRKKNARWVPSNPEIKTAASVGFILSAITVLGLVMSFTLL